MFQRTAHGIEVLIALTAEQEWVLPKGHVEPGESLATAALREIAEAERHSTEEPAGALGMDHV